MTHQKKTLGQFFTTNYQYILQNMCVPEETKFICEPFTGNGDLLNFIDCDKYYVDCYDIDPRHEFICKRDTLTDPPLYEGCFVITNPPYLARNKCKSKTLFDKYKVNDLYKCFISNLCDNKANGGILIVPLNFWCSIRDMDIQLRKLFLSVYNVLIVNVFEQQVFDDTTYTICAFQFELKTNTQTCDILFDIYPSKRKLKLHLDTSNAFTIGHELYDLPKQKQYHITRMIKGDTQTTNILVKCIDDNADNKIGLKIVGDNEIYIDNTPNKSSRTYATLSILPKIDIEKQKMLVDRFNEYLELMRDKYHSLFLTNYRESKNIARKRISFDLVYNIVGHLLCHDTIFVSSTQHRE
jgi:hypothetical protein